MKEKENHYGSELHRLKPMKDYDPDVWERMYKICKPVIRNLSRQVDARRWQVTPDIINSYFWDKMIYVFNKYYGTCSEEHLKARILSSLSVYKNHLLKYAYTEQAEYNLSLAKLEDLFDDSKELEDTSPEEKAKDDMLKMVYGYMKKHLSPDAYLVWEVLITPPPYIREQMEIRKQSKITNTLLIDFFGMPENVPSAKYIRELREEITFWEEQAKKDLHY